MVAEGAFIDLVGLQAKVSGVIRTGLGAERAADALGAIYFDDAVASLVARSRRTNVDTGWIFAVIAKARQRCDNGSVALFVASFVLRNDRPKGACLDVVFHSTVHRTRLAADTAREVDDHAVARTFGFFKFIRSGSKRGRGDKNTRRSDKAATRT